MSINLFEANHLQDWHGFWEPFKRTLAFERDLDDIFRLSVDCLGDQDLTTLGLIAQARSKVHNRPNRCVMKLVLGPDMAERGVSGRDPHSEPEIEPPHSTITYSRIEPDT